jgi:hypothetical protein
MPFSCVVRMKHITRMVRDVLAYQATICKVVFQAGSPGQQFSGAPSTFEVGHSR